MSDDMVHAVWERPPDDPEFLLIRKREQALERVLAQAGFVTGLGEPLDEAAQWLVAVLDGQADLDTVVRELQAWAAPPSSYIPPREQFVRSPRPSSTPTRARASRHCRQPNVR